MLIGFIGKMGSGKSTACDYLVENYGYRKINFKDALDDELVELFPNVISAVSGLSPEEAVKTKPTSPVMRELKQKFGTEVRRNQDPDYWVKKWIETYTKTFNTNVCVDDVRFLNEIDAIKKLGGVIVRIIRSDITDTSNHPSETALDDYEPDFSIVAEKGDLTMLNMSLDNIVEDDLGREEDSDDSGESEWRNQEEAK